MTSSGAASRHGLPIYPADGEMEETRGAPEGDGWTRRHVADPDRAEEARRMYEALGFEVMLARPDPAEMSPECGGCRDELCRSYWTVFTRRRST